MRPSQARRCRLPSLSGWPRKSPIFDTLRSKPQGDWIPYLAVDYELTKFDGNETRKGEFMAMVANDGPHYGDNVKMMGPGKYRLTLTIAPPSENQQAHFGRHVDKETGVAPWFKTFAVEYEFVYAGIGKKGAY